MDNFASYAFVKDLDVRLSEANAIEVRLRAEGNSVGAQRVVAAVNQLKTDLLAMAVSVAAAGTDILRQKERDSRVRQDSMGHGGPRLEDYLVCEPLPEYGGVGWGSVGICNETLLDANVEWWWTNEGGYEGHIGRVLYGVFQPGEAPPDSGEFREHPLFEPRGKGEFRGSGIIKNPIPARWFVRDSVTEIEALWHVEFDPIRLAFEVEVLAAQVP